MMKITFYFPNSTGLTPLSVEGVAPHEGDAVYLHAAMLESSYNSYAAKWKVKRVDYGLYVVSAVDVAYYADVHLVPWE